MSHHSIRYDQNASQDVRLKREQERFEARKQEVRRQERFLAHMKEESEARMQVAHRQERRQERSDAREQERFEALMQEYFDETTQQETNTPSGNQDIDLFPLNSDNSSCKLIQ